MTESNPERKVIFIPGKGEVETKFVGFVRDSMIYADENTLPIATGEFSGADELTDLGITYRELDKLLKSQSPS